MANNGRTDTAERQSLSEAAASIGQRIIDLEDALASATQRANDEERRAKLAEGERDRLRTELDQTRADRDHYQERCVDMKSKLGVSGKIILDVLAESKDIEKRAGDFKPRPKDQRSLQKALAESSMRVEDDRPLPNFLTVGPRIAAEPEAS